MNTNTKISDEEIAAIYKETFESMPGALRAAPECAPLVIAFARAILKKGDKGNLAKPTETPTDTSLEAVMYQIKEMTDPDDPDSYRNDDPHGCLEVVHIVAVEALASASQGNGGRD